LSDAPEGLPVDHLRGTASIRSKFLRRFQSSAFDFKASVGFERWGVGVLGRNGAGTVVNQVAQNYVRFRLQLAIESFTIYIERSNTLGETVGYVPGLPIAQAAQTFGVRWGFTN
jgi:hypothetical protein